MLVHPFGVPSALVLGQMESSTMGQSGPFRRKVKDIIAKRLVPPVKGGGSYPVWKDPRACRTGRSPKEPCLLPVHLPLRLPPQGLLRHGSDVPSPQLLTFRTCMLASSAPFSFQPLPQASHQTWMLSGSLGPLICIVKIPQLSPKSWASRVDRQTKFPLCSGQSSGVVCSFRLVTIFSLAHEDTSASVPRGCGPDPPFPQAPRDQPRPTRPFALP